VATKGYLYVYIHTVYQYPVGVHGCTAGGHAAARLSWREVEHGPAKTDISQSQTDISQSQTDISQSTTDISQSQTDISQSWARRHPSP
jgi:hypothetical protein